MLIVVAVDERDDDEGSAGDFDEESVRMLPPIIPIEARTLISSARAEIAAAVRTAARMKDFILFLP